MLTWEDCLGVAGVDDDLVDAVAEHEHLPEMVALELASYLVRTPDGQPRMKRIILEDIEAAAARGDGARVSHLRHVLAHFVACCRDGTFG